MMSVIHTEFVPNYKSFVESPILIEVGIGSNGPSVRLAPNNMGNFACLWTCRSQREKYSHTDDQLQFSPLEILKPLRCHLSNQSLESKGQIYQCTIASPPTSWNNILLVLEERRVECFKSLPRLRCIDCLVLFLYRVRMKRLDCMQLAGFINSVGSMTFSSPAPRKHLSV